MGLKATSSGLGAVAPYVQPGVLLQTSLQLPKTRAALARVKSGNGNMRILCLGDSTTSGYWSNGTTSGDLKTHSWPGALSSLLNAAGINAHINSTFGCEANNKANFDTRLSVGSGWQQGLSNSLGGNFYFANSATGNLSFTPTVNVDTFNLFFTKFGGDGTVSYNLNGGSSTNMSLNGTGIASAIATTTLGINTVNFNWVSGGNVNAGYVEAYDSSRKWVSVMNAGVYGWASGNYYPQDPNYGTQSFITLLAPDLTIIALGINDWQQSVSITTYTNNIQGLITRALTVGDCLLLAPNPTNSTIMLPQQQPYISAEYALAQSNNIPVVDIWSRFVSQPSASVLGMMGDFLHPNGVGYADIAQAVMNAINV